jgi:hypothetical protein
MMMWRTALALMALVVVAPAEVGATPTVEVTSVERSDTGALRIAVRYDGGEAPSFRLTPVCRHTPPASWVVASTVTMEPDSNRAVLEVEEDLSSFTDRRHPCEAQGFNVQMLDWDDVVASAAVPVETSTPRTADAGAPPSGRTDPRFGVAGSKIRAPQTKMSEAGITFAFTNRITLNLSYERTAYAPLMRHDHDDGILTGVQIGF